MPQIIKKENKITEPLVLNNPYPVLVCDDFISKEYCKILIEEASNFLPSKTNENRMMVPWKSIVFRNLTKSSNAWAALEREMPNNAFKIFCKYFNNENQSKNIIYKNWIKKKSIKLVNELYNISSILLSKKQLRNYQENLEKECRRLPNKLLFIYSLIGLFDAVYRNILGTIDLFKGTIKLTPLFDYSIANKGYGREIHRDTDSRAFVLLLYLNNLEDETTGGNFCVFENTKEYKKYPSQIRSSDAKKVLEVHPKAGRLVIFFNQANAYHGVSEMSYSKKGRNFIYGGFTMQNSLNSPSNKLKKNSVPTDYFLYK
tara:strand:- start:911 stop:1855 length:945 start_codon:yes stop_codon:yes gene_type:complete